MMGEVYILRKNLLSTAEKEEIFQPERATLHLTVDIIEETVM
jgi:hypothetical protein